ncbi:HlyD family secretion protein [Plesiomonas shigelloides]|uniref:HlyD family secretion protein n=1 Tax=Plesiomonas shigelloides TaxID=703 RepID=UPI0012622709|nr:HlyD family efflux transporter periplasmic adaptor subunit [Plesiomonas shigelloides]KAB7658467.1 HlyD family efflux transporter periplasmic adaptor subunit [Plesiomonas shigelloides]
MRNEMRTVKRDYLKRGVFAALCLLLLGGCDFAPSLQALGTLERDRLTYPAMAAETVIAMPVQEGQAVTRGTLLVQLDPAHQQTLVEQASASLQAAQANLQKLEQGARSEDIAAAEAHWRGTQALEKESILQYQRMVQLFARKAVGQAELDQALASRNNSQAQVNAAYQQWLALKNGSRPEDIAQARANVAAAQAKLAESQIALQQLSVVATRDGIVESLPFHLGDRPVTGNTLVVMLADQAPYARVYIPEPFRTQIHVGMTLPVWVDGVNEPMTGTVRKIAHDPAFTPYYALNREDRARLVYLAEVQLSPEHSNLPSGIPAQVILP